MLVLLVSPAVALLDAIGYNILSSPVIAVGTATPQSTSHAVYGQVDDGLFVGVPEPASRALFGFGLTALCALRRR